MQEHVRMLALTFILGGLMLYQNEGVTAVQNSDLPATIASYTQEASLFSWFNKKEAIEEEDETETTFRTSPRPQNNDTNTENNTTLLTKSIEDLNDETKEGVVGAAPPVTLKIGRAKEKSPEREYLLLTANRSVTITGWVLESDVTKSKATIPEGSTLLTHERDSKDGLISLAPGDTVYLITGETPLKTSFRENMCTGYLTEYGSFYPSLKKSCPLPSDELLSYGISQSDDDCYEFVEGIRQCEIVSDSKLDGATLSNRCENFVEHTLTYEGCVDDHEDKPGFLGAGVWRVYLDKEGELWRSMNETILLKDKKGRVIATLKY